MLQKRESSVKLLPDLPEGVSFRDNAIIINESKNITVLSSKCTHLGCRINELKDGKLVCPCHGSTYDKEGHVLEGPASENLDTLAVISKPLKEEVIINV